MEDERAYDTLKQMIREKLSLEIEDEEDTKRINKNVLECMQYKKHVSKELIFILPSCPFPICSCRKKYQQNVIHFKFLTTSNFKKIKWLLGKGKRKMARGQFSLRK